MHKAVIKITSKDGAVIELKNVTHFDVLFDTVQDNVRQKSKGIIPKLVIKGKFSSGNADEVGNKEGKALFEWSKDFTKDGQNRKVEVDVYLSEDSIYRSYTYEEMFIVDYNEHYTSQKATTDGNQASEDTFELKLSQVENKISTIDTVAL